MLLAILTLVTRPIAADGIDIIYSNFLPAGFENDDQEVLHFNQEYPEFDVKYDVAVEDDDQETLESVDESPNRNVNSISQLT